MEFIQSCRYRHALALSLEFTEFCRQLMRLPVQRLDRLEGWFFTMAGESLSLQPCAEAALVVIRRWRGFTLALEKSLSGQDPGAVLDAGKEQW